MAAFREEGVPLTIGRDLRGEDSILRVVLDPAESRLEGELAVDIFRSAQDADTFAERVDDRQPWPRHLRRANVIVFFAEGDDELARRVEAAMNRL